MKTGPSAAAVLAGGIGLAAFGIVSTLAEAIASFSKALTWSKAVGALSGKTIIGVLVWLVAWLILGLAWKDREVKLGPIAVVAAILTVIGLLTTFPPFFDLFSAD